MTDAQLAQLALMVADLRGAYEQAQQRVTELERLVAALQAQLAERDGADALG